MAATSAAAATAIPVDATTTPARDRMASKVRGSAPGAGGNRFAASARFIARCTVAYVFGDFHICARRLFDA